MPEEEIVQEGAGQDTEQLEEDTSPAVPAEGEEGEDPEFSEAMRPKKIQIPVDRATIRALTKKQKKRSKRKKIILIVVLALVILGLALLIFLQITGRANVFGFYDEWREENLNFEERDEDLTDRENAVLVKEQQLAAEEERLNALAEELNTEAASASYNAELAFEDYFDSLSEDKVEEIMRVSTIYSKMDPMAAAEILSVVYDANDISVIVFYMRPAAAAEMLPYLDTKLAAEVTQNLVN